MNTSGPIVLVGLPRSGSTLLTAILNKSPDHYALNDLYYLQLIDSQNSWNGFATLGQAREAKALVRNMVRHRSAIHSPKGIANSAEMTADQLDAALTEIDAQWPNDNSTEVSGDWASILEAAIMAGARAVGKTRWGWNTPQDYHHVDRIMARWPEARVIFLLRDPRTTLKSYKYYPKRPQAYRYHPIAQSMAWRNAARAWGKLNTKYPDNVLLISYEDLVAETREHLERINTVLSAQIDTRLDLDSLGSNSSYGSRKAERTDRILTPAELWLSDAVLYEERRALGYDEEQCAVSLSGGLPLFGRTIKFAGYYGKQILTSRESRQRIKRLLMPR